MLSYMRSSILTLSLAFLHGAVFTAVGAPPDLAEHIEKLRPKLPEGFTAVAQAPFVVIGDEAPEAVERRAVATVKWAVDRFKQDYFKLDPVDTIDIWLFKDKESYMKHVPRIFGETPATPFGYYSPENKALIMNIATGGGTLVHEIVHPFMAANFPACPPWFNEGLGSLYEQCHDQDGHIHGQTNWRLAGLQQAIRLRRTVPFETLLAMDEDRFYKRDRGTNYGQSRYLCYYLQEKGKLIRFYEKLVANAKTDPSGVKTLREVLGQEDMVAFQKEWEGFVLGLKFP